jgi:Xaa-Pro aminopeptidase
MSDRPGSLRDHLIRDELDAILVTQGENRRYLSGFTGSAGCLLVSHNEAILATDFRYVEQAQAQAPAFQTLRVTDGLAKWLLPLASDLGIRRLGFEEGDLPYSTYRELAAGVGEAANDVSLVPTLSLVESLRAVKDETELGLLAKAAGLADAALEEVLPGIRPGISERQLAWKLESFMREHGSEPLPFDVIVASGPNSALPHARPTDRSIGSAEPVVIDLGARVNGYCSDLSRTICLGNEDSTFWRVYDIVLGAQLTAIETVQAGMSGEQADQLARTVIVQAGHEDAFGHGLGHGVGLAAHEEPRLGPRSSSVLADGMVFTIEPGIYLSGWGGVRIEDTVVLENGKARPLTRASKTRR